MTNVIKKNLAVLAALFIAGAVFVLATRLTNAQDVLEDGTVVDNSSQTTEESNETTSEAAEEAADEAVSAEEATTTTEATAETYSFIAQKGDSYTKMARKAVQIFGLDNKVDLSGAQIVYVETNLTQLANSPELDLGEAVTISKTTVGEWVEKAKQLTNAQKALWQVYADRADFNTNNVGEAR
jgi:hypothetical protein